MAIPSDAIPYGILAEGKLLQPLADIDNHAQQMFDTLVEQMKESEGITEQLKERNHLKWVGPMTNIDNKLIYA